MITWAIAYMLKNPGLTGPVGRLVFIGIVADILINAFWVSGLVVMWESR